MSAIDDVYLGQSEPAGSCLLALREIICAQSPEITAALQYGMPTFRYKGKRFCYLWTQQKTGRPYIGFIDGNRLDHPGLIAEKRSRMKVLLIDPEADLPLETITTLLRQAMQLVVGYDPRRVADDITHHQSVFRTLPFHSDNPERIR